MVCRIGGVCAASRREALQAALLAPATTMLVWSAPPSSSAATAGPLRMMTSGEEAALQAVLSKTLTKTKAPVLLRMLFHDAATFRTGTADGGPNASLQFELDRPENGGLQRGWSMVRDVCAPFGRLLLHRQMCGRHAPSTASSAPCPRCRVRNAHPGHGLHLSRSSTHPCILPCMPPITAACTPHPQAAPHICEHAGAEAFRKF
jgi:hypothetical protein